jgi:hypothetical protein
MLEISSNPTELAVQIIGVPDQVVASTKLALYSRVVFKNSSTFDFHNLKVGSLNVLIELFNQVRQYKF